MAAFFRSGLDSQAGDDLQTLVLINPPGYVQYSGEEPPLPGNNHVFLSSVAASMASQPPHASQQVVDIPLPPVAVTGESSSQSMQQRSGGGSGTVSPYCGFSPRNHGNLWMSSRDAGTSHGGGATLKSTTPRSQHQQGLSLSLSFQQQAVQQQPHLSPNYITFGAESTSRPHQASDSSAVEENRASSLGAAISVSGGAVSSKYMKAAQELLDELVNVGHEVLQKKDRPKKSTGETGSGTRAGDEGTCGKSGPELAAERQEVQMKKAKLMSMLDEVEQRYRQYHHQMHIVVASFEQVTGIGSARTYTSLALKTISKQFRCLRDAIERQIRAAEKCLGEEDGGCSLQAGKLHGSSSSSTSSRLKFVDHHFRQQQTLQQLGIISNSNNNIPWRPQRGLPERAVSVLRAWLFEHFLHPYPKDSDKQMLAKQTGLTRSQVSNWFINARVRLWKPMIEDMYTEETNQNGNHKVSTSATEKPSKNGYSNKEDSSSMSAAAPPSTSANPTFPIGTNHGFSPMGSSELERIAQIGSKKPRSSIEGDDKLPPEHELQQLPPLAVGFRDETRQNSRQSYSRLRSPPASFMQQYQMEEDIRRPYDSEQFMAAPRFSAGNNNNNNNNISLSLGLPRYENLSVVQVGAHHHYQDFLHGRGRSIPQLNELNNLSSPDATDSFERINTQNNRKRFAAAQLMPDFCVLKSRSRVVRRNCTALVQSSKISSGLETHAEPTHQSSVLSHTFGTGSRLLKSALSMSSSSSSSDSGQWRVDEMSLGAGLAILSETRGL
ncbi:hypothetical protein SAY86_025052 [Trapa natans]|uniref:Homeobox domain-containing protein n=1 Tax=Trapa natans TaxID=22666 RepID=A0AAN7MIA5_TRANT|nr:hypothetical protein SAY86_025052 [Trapa natans]